MEINATVPRETTCPHCRRLVDISECDAFERVTCPNCEKELTVPADFGRFRLQKIAGTGNMGVVFKAWDNSIKMPIALKIAREELEGSNLFYESLMAEVAIAGKTKHKNLIEIYDYGRIEGSPYIAMEYISGGTVRDRMTAQTTAIRERSILGWAMSTAEGLQCANRSGMVHGDLKPANLLFDHNDMIKVADFGLARAEGQATNDIWGTPMYIAPEKAQGKAEDFRSDIYSLGVIMWQLLAGGTPPFDAPTSTGLVRDHVNGAIPDVTLVRPEVSYHTGIIVRRMMAKTPERRFNSYEYLLAELKAAHRTAAHKARHQTP